MKFSNIAFAVMAAIVLFGVVVFVIAGPGPKKGYTQNDYSAIAESMTQDFTK